MSKKISIAIDAMGGDNSPDKTIQGISFFINVYQLYRGKICPHWDLNPGFKLRKLASYPS